MRGRVRGEGVGSEFGSKRALKLSSDMPNLPRIPLPSSLSFPSISSFCCSSLAAAAASSRGTAAAAALVRVRVRVRVRVKVRDTEG